MLSLLMTLPRATVLAAAWWYERVANPFQAAAFDWFYVPIRKRFGHGPAWRVATFVEMQLLRIVLLDWLVWPIAKNHLQAKWKAELEAENLAYYRSLDGGAE